MLCIIIFLTQVVYNYCCTLPLPGWLIATNFFLPSMLTPPLSSVCNLCSCLSALLLSCLSFLLFLLHTSSLAFSSFLFLFLLLLSSSCCFSLIPCSLSLYQMWVYCRFLFLVFCLPSEYLCCFLSISQLFSSSLLLTAFRLYQCYLLFLNKVAG